MSTRSNLLLSHPSPRTSGASFFNCSNRLISFGNASSFPPSISSNPPSASLTTSLSGPPPHQTFTIGLDTIELTLAPPLLAWGQELHYGFVLYLPSSSTNSNNSSNKDNGDGGIPLGNTGPPPLELIRQQSEDGDLPGRICVNGSLEGLMERMVGSSSSSSSETAPAPVNATVMLWSYTKCPGRPDVEQSQLYQCADITLNIPPSSMQASSQQICINSTAPPADFDDGQCGMLSREQHGLHGPAIAGLVACVLFGAFLLVAAAWAVVRRRMQEKESANMGVVMVDDDLQHQHQHQHQQQQQQQQGAGNGFEMPFFARRACGRELSRERLDLEQEQLPSYAEAVANSATYIPTK